MFRLSRNLTAARIRARSDEASPRSHPTGWFSLSNIEWILSFSLDMPRVFLKRSKPFMISSSRDERDWTKKSAMLIALFVLRHSATLQQRKSLWISCVHPSDGETRESSINAPRRLARRNVMNWILIINELLDSLLRGNQDFAGILGQFAMITEKLIWAAQPKLCRPTPVANIINTKHQRLAYCEIKQRNRVRDSIPVETAYLRATSFHGWRRSETVLRQCLSECNFGNLLDAAFKVDRSVSCDWIQYLRCRRRDSMITRVHNLRICF
jgi:hypothetical protein